MFNKKSMKCSSSHNAIFVLFFRQSSCFPSLLKEKSDEEEKLWFSTCFSVKIFSFVSLKQARNPGTVEKRIANSDWRTDRLMNWHDGLTGVQYLSEYILRSKKGTLKNPGETFFKNLLNHFWRKNPVAQWKWVGLNLLYHFWNRGENSE